MMHSSSDFQPLSFAESLLPPSPTSQHRHDGESSEENSDPVRVFPRRKAGEPRRERNQKGKAVLLTKQKLAPFFNIPLSEVAELLGIGATALKSSCRKLGIARWPFPAQAHSSDRESHVQVSVITTQESHPRQQQQETPHAPSHASSTSVRAPAAQQQGQSGPSATFWEQCLLEGLMQDLSTQDTTAWRSEVEDFLPDSSTTTATANSTLGSREGTTIDTTQSTVSVSVSVSNLEDVQHAYEERSAHYSTYWAYRSA